MPEWSAPKHVKAFSTQRLGGVSAAPFASFNLGQHVGDEQQAVVENRQLLVTEWALPNEPLWLDQQHTIDIQTDEHCFDGRPCDGTYTGQAKRICAVMTADCVPVFITDQQGSAVAVVHAGWRGLAGGIIEKAMQLFTVDTTDLLVWAGPAISPLHFEIGADVKKMLGGSEQFYRENPRRSGHYFCDLYGLAGERVQRLGASYGHSQACTYRDEESYFSYRRDGRTGRMVSIIWMDT